MAVRLLFREKSSENRCGERSVERTPDDRIRWEWHSHQNSTVALVRICTPNWGTSPKMYAIKRLPHSLACISRFFVNYVFLLQFIEYIRYIKKKVWSLGRKDPLEKEMTIHSCLENSMDRGAWRATVHGVTKSWTQRSD